MGIPLEISKHLQSSDMSQEDFDFFRKLIYDNSGISLAENKKTMVGTRIAKRIRQVGLKDYQGYRSLLESPGNNELQSFINVLTTNKTHFFREQDHFDFLESFLPKYKPASGRIYLWSGACSTGVEVYSLAMHLNELRNRVSSFHDFRILGTDIDTTVLEKAQEGIYDKQIVEVELDPNLRDKYFQKVSSDAYEFSNEIKSTMKFRRHNLIHDPPIGLQFDIIFIRNVLIYFEPEDIYKVAEKATKSLRVGGALIVGQCEPLRKLPNGLKSEDTSIYVRVE